MLETFTKKAAQAIFLSQKEAKRKDSQVIAEQHLLVGLIEQETGIAAQVLQMQKLDLKTMRNHSDHCGSYRCKNISETVIFGAGTQQVMDRAEKEASDYGHLLIDTEHILLAVMHPSIRGCTSSIILHKMERLNFSLAKQNVIQLMADKTHAKGLNSKTYERALRLIPTVRKFSLDLSQEAMKGKMDPVIGRSKEINRVTQVVGRRSKNNPCLLGEPGVGKTAIAEGLALRIIKNNIPVNLQNKYIMSLDVGRIIAGTKYRGEFEGRLTAVIAESKRTKLVILLIDEVHTIITAGNAEGSLGAGNMLKPALSRGELQVLGATTFVEYSKYIEKDAAMERRFQPVKIPEPNVVDTVQILYGLRDKYENHHNVVIENNALKTAAELAARHIHDRFLPDKAIDLVDQSASRAQIMGLESSPEILGFKKDLDKIKTQKKGALQSKNFRDLVVCKREEKRLNRKIRNGLKKLKDEITKTNSLQENQSLKILVTVNERSVLECVSIWTRIPISEITPNTGVEIKELMAKMNTAVIAQERAVSVVANAIRRCRVGLNPEGRPITNFFFVGPTGVGKTELAKVVTSFFFGSSKKMIRFDMSEFAERHSIAKLIGSPPGYQGYDEPGRLTDAIRNNPFSLLLFDEIEKAHSWVQNLFLQILEDGRLSDGKGRSVDFCNTIIVLTSNIGADNVDWFYSKKGKKDWYKNHLWQYPDKTKTDHLLDLVYPDLQRKFKPEILNRIDEIVVFDSIDLNAAWFIVYSMIDKLDARVYKKLSIGILITIAACKKIAENNFDRAYGARPIRRAITKVIEDPMTILVLRGRLRRNHYLIFNSLKNGPVEFRFVRDGDCPERDEFNKVKMWTLGRESCPEKARVLRRLYAPKEEQEETEDEQEEI